MPIETTGGRRIGLILDSIAAYDRGVIRGVTNFTSAHPQYTTLVQPRWTFESKLPAFRGRVDGVVIHSADRRSERNVLSWRVPVVSVAPPYIPERFATVMIDNSAVSTMAAEYFATLGFKNWAFCGPKDLEYVRQRLDTFQKLAGQAGVGLHQCPARDPRQTRQWLEQLPKPVAIYAASDFWAHRVLEACRAAGIVVPDQAAVLGVDDDALFNALAIPPLSSIALPVEQLGYDAAELLHCLISGVRPLKRNRTLPPLGVVTRRSTDVHALVDEDIAAVLRYIRDHPAQRMHTEELLNLVTCSRRSLERRFRAALGRSVSDEVRRVRVANAKRLLTTTEMKVAQIAYACGFLSPTRLGVIFRTATQMTPRQFRQRARLASIAASTSL